MKNLVRSNDGTALVEFAIIAPVLIFLLMGLIEIGRYTSLAIMAANAARAGVQYGAQNLSTAADSTGMENAALQDAQSLASWGTPIANHVCSTDGGVTFGSCPGSGAALPANTVYYVQVQVSGTFTPLVSYPGLPSKVPVSGSAIMKVAQQ